MNEKWMEEIKHNDAVCFVEKYFPEQSFGDKTERVAELCRIAEKSGFADCESIRKIVSAQIGKNAMPLNDEMIAPDGRRIIGKKYISDADASKSGACKACLEYAGRIFKWPEEKDKMPVLPRHPNCKCHYEDVYDKKLTWTEQAKILVEKTKEYLKQLTAAKHKVTDMAQKTTLAVNQQKRNNSDNTIQHNDAVLKAVNYYLELNKSVDSELLLLDQNLNFFKQWVYVNISFHDLLKWAQNFIVTSLIGIEKCKLLSKKEHYDRLKLCCQQIKSLPKSPKEAVKQGFTKAADHENRYHGLHLGNTKYYNKMTGQEVVFDEKGNIVLDVKYLGTYNYGTFPKSIAHVINDVLPYYLWGNTPNDTTSLPQRIFGTGKEEK